MHQSAGPDPRSTETIAMASRCMGCPGCIGPCRALLELMTLPNAVLRRSKDT